MDKNGFQAGYVDSDGARLYFERAGEGPDLVLVHAGVADRRMWDDQFEAFAARFRVTRWDLRGFGLSKKIALPFSNRGDLGRLCVGLGIERAHFIGASIGAGAALDFALEEPGRVLSLVLAAPAVSGWQFQGPPPPKMLELIEARRSGDLERAAGLAVEIWVDGPNRSPGQVDARVRDRVRAMSLEALGLQAAYLCETGFLPETQPERPAFGRLREVAAPLLALYGDEDDEVMEEIATALTSGVKRGRWAVIPGTAHFPNMERPGMFNRVVNDFIDRL